MVGDFAEEEKGGGLGREGKGPIGLAYRWKEIALMSRYSN